MSALVDRGKPPRRWWLWGLVGLALATVVVGGAVVLLTANRAHRSVTDTPVAAGLARAGGDSQALADVLLARVAGSVGRAPVALAYADGRSPVYVVGGRTGLLDSADATLLTATRALAVTAFRAGTGPVPFTDEPGGPLGGRQRCAVIDVSGVSTAACGWVDADTVGVALSPLRTAAGLAEVLGRLRVDLER